MKIFKAISGLVLIASLCMLCGYQSQSDIAIETPAVSGTFDFTVLKAGQADAILMQTENNSIILDCGENPAEKETTSLLDTLSTEVYSTKNGDVCILSDGKEIKIVQ